MDKFERRSVLSGLGQSQVGRRLGRSALDLTVEACLAAMDDAGLNRDDIDGMCAWPGDIYISDGFSGPGVPQTQDALRLGLNWYQAGPEGPAQLGAVVNAMLAVAAGLCRHVLVYRTVTESSGQQSGTRAATISTDTARLPSYMQWLLPFGSMSSPTWIAPWATRYMAEFGLTREQLGQIPLTGRANAALNDAAVYRSPLTMDDYLTARMISTPLCLYDCDVPVDGSTAFVVSAADTVADLKGAPLRFEAVGTAITGRPSWDQRADITTMAAADAGKHLWSRTDLTPADVNVAGLYDGFSILTVLWLESLGFCPRGEAGAFLEGGRSIARDGTLPLNTGGGQLSAGRLHGFGHLHEVATQLRGAAGARQVRDAEVGVVGTGGGPLAGCLLLTR
ncbi:thiolase family protein [Dactylosporangium sp. NPDC005572]|uniref:thiolase family protein n=1 Tax=Dactylosporangium sp. NPDC005572 TaxID=3156889 RepID=UPI0033B090F7